MARQLFAISALLFLCVSGAEALADPVQFSGGDGSAADPYRISEADQLTAIGTNPNLLSKCFIQICDIDLAGYVFDRAVIAPDAETGSPFDGIRFEGTYDGQHYSIKNLHIDASTSGSSFAALFGAAKNAVLKNITLSRCWINGNGSTGSLVGEVSYSQISGCSVEGTIHGGGAGFTSLASESIIENCFIQCNADFSAFIGWAHYCTIRNCYASGRVESGAGFIGHATDTELIHCYSTTLTYASADQGFIGRKDNRDYYTGCFWDVETSGTSISQGDATGLTTDQMLDPQTYLDAGWDFTSVWKMEEGDYPSFQWQEETTTVPDVIGLTSFGEAEGFLNQAGLRLGGTEWVYHAAAPGTVLEIRPFAGATVVRGRDVYLRISKGPSPYSGGSGTKANPFLISDAAELNHLAVTAEDSRLSFLLIQDIDMNPALPNGQVYRQALIGSEVSFSGVFDGGGHSISNLTIESSNLLNLGLFGRVESGGIVKNLQLENLSLSGNGTLGGLAAVNSGTVHDCHVQGIIQSQSGTYTGGLIGYGAGKVTQSSFTGKVTADSGSLGGLIGSSSVGFVDSCFAVAEVTGSSGNTGGLAGSFQQVISNCYSQGTVNGKAGGTGGLFGTGVGTATCSYTNSRVSIDGLPADGPAGYFWNQHGKMGALSETELKHQASFIGLDFMGDPAYGNQDLWWIDEGNGFPLLWWQLDLEAIGSILKISADRFTFRVGQGDPNPDSQVLIITNIGHGTLNWNLDTTELPDWLSILPTSGHLGCQESAPVVVAADTVALERGIYSHTLSIPDPSAQQRSLSVTVDLEVVGFMGGDGSAADPYLISTVEELLLIGSDPVLLTKCYRLTNDIAFNPATHPRHVFTEAVIGTGAIFTGCFDGDGHHIANLTIETSEVSPGWPGFFRRIGSGGTVKDLHLDHVSIRIRGTCGGSLCAINSGTIFNCSATGVIEKVGDYDAYLGWGGLVGSNNMGVVDSCFAAVDMNVSGTPVGGLVGEDRQGTIRSSTAVGNVIARGGFPLHGAGGLLGYGEKSELVFCTAAGDVTLSDGSNAGGLAGHLYEAVVRRCGALGDVTSGSESLYTGGLVGETMLTSIEFCYAEGDVRGGDRVGGVAGGPYAQLSHCYATGHVSGRNYVGGLMGSGAATSCYAAGTVKGRTYVHGLGSGSTVSHNYYLKSDELMGFEVTGYPTPLTEAQMKQRASFSEWSFVGDAPPSTDAWRMDAEGIDYPKLSWEYGMYGDFDCSRDVEFADLAVLAERWLSLEEEGRFSYACDSNGDGIIDLGDYAVLAAGWRKPFMHVSDHRLNLLVQEGQAEASRTLTIQNTGQDVLQWKLLADRGLPAWLSISPAEGALGPAESQAVTLTVRSDDLAAGYYKALFRIEGEGALNSPQIVLMQLTVSPFAGGSGTPEDPFLVATADQLIAIGEDQRLLTRCFRLTSDIDLDGILFADAVIAQGDRAHTGYNFNFKGVGFNGIFDGNGHRILNLTIETQGANASCLGLFGQLGAMGEVRNLGLEHVSIAGGPDSYFIGAVAGWVDGGIQDGSYGYDPHRWLRGTVRGCYVTGALGGTSYIGGLTGINGGEILNSYADVSITGSQYLGGIAGINSSINTNDYCVGHILYCYATGSIDGSDYLGGITLCTHISTDVLIRSCYYLDTLPPSCPIRSFPLTESQMRQQASYAGWDFAGETANGTEDIWRIDEGNDTPRLWWEQD